MYHNTYNLLTWFYKKDYKWISLTQCVWSQMKAQCVNEWDEYKDLKLNESCILNILFNDDCWNFSCLNLIELIYSWSWKLVVIDFLLTIGLPLTRCRITVWLVNLTVGLNFQIVGSPFYRCRITVSVQRLIYQFCAMSVNHYLDVGSPLVSRG